MNTKAKRPRRARKTSRASDRISHLHVVIDDKLREKLEEHARKLEGAPPRIKNYEAPRPNLSAAVRDLLRVSLGLSSAPA